jgi:hypothetical protein
MTREEFDAGYDGLHVPMECEDHPGQPWHCKKIAISFDKDGIGRYNGSRHMFFTGEGEPCKCPGTKLRLVLEG